MRAVRITVVFAMALTAGACPRSAPLDPDPVTETSPREPVWLRASCDLPERITRERDRLEGLGAVEIAGGQPYRWTFSCPGSALLIDVEPAGPTADGEPVLWAGAVGDPPGVVTILLDVGAGQEQLVERLTGLDRPRTLQIDLATGVVSDR